MAWDIQKNLGTFFTAAVFMLPIATGPVHADSSQPSNPLIKTSLTPTQPQPVNIGTAALLSKQSRMVVLHYGNGITTADNAAKVLHLNGIPAVALPGGKEGDIALFVNGKPRGNFKNDDAFGKLLPLAESYYKEEYPQSSSSPSASLELQN